VQYYVFRDPNLGFLMPASPEQETALRPFEVRADLVEQAKAGLVGRSEGVVPSAMHLVGVTDLTDEEYRLWVRDACERVARARLVLEEQGSHASQWAAITSITAKLGGTPETLRHWVRQAERDAGRRPGLTSSERDQPKELERENRELKRANEILRKASAHFAQAELDRRAK
jgi:transposase